MKNILPFLTCLCISHAVLGQELDDLVKLRQQYLQAANKALHPITLKYIEHLDLLNSSYKSQGKNQEAILVEGEIMRIKSLKDDGFVHLPTEADTTVTKSGETDENHLTAIQGVWSRRGVGALWERFEFKGPDMMVRTQRFPTQCGGTSEQISNYTVKITELKLVITPQGQQHSEYRDWLEISIPFSLENLVMTESNTQPGRSTKSTIYLERKPLMSSASFWQHDQVDAICDGIEPKTSTDYGVPRQTWFPSRGTNEWVQLDFQQPRNLSRCDVYWFDDVDSGGACHVPKSARVLYKAGGEWKPVVAKRGMGVAQNRWNRLNFEAVETTALRLEVQLESKFSGGVLEWKGDW